MLSKCIANDGHTFCQVPDLAFNERPFLEQAPQILPQASSDTDSSSASDIGVYPPDRNKPSKRSVDIIYSLPKKTAATSTRPLTASADIDYKGERSLPFQAAKLISGRPVFKRSKLDDSEANNKLDTMPLAQSYSQPLPSDDRRLPTEDVLPTISVNEDADERSSQISAASRLRRQQFQQHNHFQALARIQDTHPARQQLTLNEELAILDFPNVAAEDHGPSASYGRAVVRPRRIGQRLTQRVDIPPSQAIMETTNPARSGLIKPDEADFVASQSPVHIYVPYDNSNPAAIPVADWLFSPTPSTSSRQEMQDQEPHHHHNPHQNHIPNFETGLEGFEDNDELPDEDLSSDIDVGQYKDEIMMVETSDPGHDNEQYDICQYDPQEHCCSSDLDERAMECNNDLYSLDMLEGNHQGYSVDDPGGHHVFHPTSSSQDRRARRVMLSASSPPHRTHITQMKDRSSPPRAIDLDDPAPFRQGRAALFARGGTAAAFIYDNPSSSSSSVQKQRFWKPYIQ